MQTSPSRPANGFNSLVGFAAPVQWRSASRALPVPAFVAKRFEFARGIVVQAGRTVEQYKNAGKLSDMRVSGWMPGNRLEDMDRDGIDKAVCFGGDSLSTGDTELDLESFDAFNRWQPDVCQDSGGRLSQHAAEIADFLFDVLERHPVGVPWRCIDKEANSNNVITW